MHEPLPGLYIHLPYCRVLCPYCDFVKRASDDGVPEAFVDALCAEIANAEGPSGAQSVFLGGGTPSLLSPDAFTRVFGALRERFTIDDGAEITIEVNPEDVSDESIAAWKSAGINRVSLGVQSFNDDALRFLGRGHDADCARRACEQVAASFANWGIDLIFGGKPAETWTATLNEARRFAPPHISTYSLTYEERTPFWKRRAEAIEDDLGLELYREGHEALHEYAHYEVSNFAKDGFDSAHNRIYWRNETYLGFGPGAYSYWDGVRARNEYRVDAYIAHPGSRAESLALTDAEIKLETLIQHFRTQSGIAESYYAERFGTTLSGEFGEALVELSKRGLVEHEDGVYRPTRTGYELNDEIGLRLLQCFD